MVNQLHKNLCIRLTAPHGNEIDIVSSDLPVVITVTGGIEPPPQALVQLGLEKTQYQFGERFTATLTEQLGWGYDLYAAVLL
ncbi:MAG: hypothetical protein BWK78_01105, partial [Thiotrichaceae bacterium IS1]